MDDSRIIELFEQRDERAIAESNVKYGQLCTRVAMNILQNAQDAEDCVNDTYLKAWNAIPPARPARLGAFLAKITRNLSLDRYRASHAAKRGEYMLEESLDELGECIPAGEHARPDTEAEARRIGECITRFLGRQTPDARDVFICRYFYADSLESIARDFGFSESKVKSMLHRTRHKLRKYLESEEVDL